MTKKEIFEKYGIRYNDGKILSPIGLVCPVLKEGNTKTGKAVYTFSMLAGTSEFSVDIAGKMYTVSGTCVCNCVGCYAKVGHYTGKDVIKSMAINTILVNEYPDFIEKAIRAQLEILGRGEIRIHASGDFNTKNPDLYADMWQRIAADFPSFRFWTYTKIKKYESLFDGMKNANIVKSIIPHIGINFGHCDYIINAYYTLKSLELPVYICKCGIDKNQHCENCGVCTAYKYVLFVEHSTAYKAENDPLYDKLCEIVNNQ